MHISNKLSLLLVAAAALSGGCGKKSDTLAKDSLQPGPGFSLLIQNTPQGGMLPPEITCKGANVSPSVIWKEEPAGVASYALIMDDVEGATPQDPIIHWVIYNIPANAHGLDGHLDTIETLPNGARQGISSDGKTGYSGPCPPASPIPHHYGFHLLALDTMLPGRPGLTGRDIMAMAQGHTKGRADFTGVLADPTAKPGVPPLPHPPGLPAGAPPPPMGPGTKKLPAHGLTGPAPGTQTH